jgi:hypothetical protein
VKFLARGRGFVFLGSGETVLGLSTPDASQAPAVRMKLLGANPRRVPSAWMSPRARSTTSPGTMPAGGTTSSSSRCVRDRERQLRALGWLEQRERRRLRDQAKSRRLGPTCSPMSRLGGSPRRSVHLLTKAGGKR